MSVSCSVQAAPSKAVARPNYEIHSIPQVRTTSVAFQSATHNRRKEFRTTEGTSKLVAGAVLRRIDNVMQTLKTGLLVLTAVLLTAVALQNTDPVETKLLGFSFETPQSVLLVVTLLLGFLLGVIVTVRIGRTPKASKEKPVVKADEKPDSNIGGSAETQIDAQES
jgi:uncharacterized integral membrane protein